jgi:hypothetical protein
VAELLPLLHQLLLASFESFIIEPSRWNQLQVTYRDPDGMGLPGEKGSEYQAYAELVRVSKTTGTWGKITSFDSNLQCAGGPSLCQATTLPRRSR